MKQFLLSLLYWSCLQISASLPVEDKPGFTPWKRTIEPLDAEKFSGKLGIFKKSKFDLPDPTCREKMKPDEGCWEMDQFTVAKMIEARKPEANNCGLKCLFYTEKLSGGAERSANYVLWNQLTAAATEGPPKYLTIWALHDRKYYPTEWKDGKKDSAFLDESLETKCAYLDREDNDEKDEIIGCQRRYFMSMSKAMAAECSGEVFLMTRADLGDLKRKEGEEQKLVKTPENGIWWQVEFPTLIDPNRPKEKEITKITYIQVEDLTDAEFKVLQALDEDKKTPPKELHRNDYWPEGPGKRHLNEWYKDPKNDPSQQKRSPDEFIAGAGEKEDSQQKRSPDEFNPGADKKEDPQQKRSPATHEVVRRANDNSDPDKVCKSGDDCYPYPHRINDMYEMYKDVVW